MKIREQLVAYLEGTLSSKDRIEIAYLIERSSRWQRELKLLEQTRFQLKNEMPFLGQPSQYEIQAFLPEILDRSSQSRWWEGLRTSLLVCGLIGLLVIAPLVLHSRSVGAVDGLPQNVPLSTSTQQVVVQADEVTEEALVVVVDTEAWASWSASPAPMPNATIEPSREAPSKWR